MPLASPTERCDEAQKEEEEDEEEEEEDAMERAASKDEIKKALKNTKKDKAPGLDNIAPELLKEYMDLTANILCNLIEKIWKQEKIPED
jgi:hypothetical protein